MISGEKLTQFRKSKKLTQEQFAEVIGIKRTAYAAYETNRVQMSIEMLQKVSKHFNIRLDELLLSLNESEENPQNDGFQKATRPVEYINSETKSGQNRLLEIIEKQADTIKSQQETIHFLTLSQGNASGRIVTGR